VKRKAGTFEEFKEYTLAVARGERTVDPREPRVWCQRIEAGAAEQEVQFASIEAGAKLLSAKNRALLRIIAERHPRSVTELAVMTGRAEQNVLRTLKKLETAGVVRLDKGEGGARRPVLAARKVRFEIDLLGSN
jgi:predicted transcriptional regulator